MLHFWPRLNNFLPKFGVLAICIVLWELFLRDNVAAILSEFSRNYVFQNYGILPSAGIKEFRNLDIDDNKQLTLNEWLPHYYKCHKTQLNIEDVQHESFDEGNTSETVTLQAYFTPIKLQSCLKDFKSENEKNPKLYTGLLNWREPFEREAHFATNEFRAFLPPDYIACGTTWWIIDPVASESVDQATSFVYSASNPSKFLEKLFRMFHPNPFLLTRFKPRGILAALRAKNNDLFHIMFRAHVEYQLEEPPNFPFWFTPSQFRGSLIIDKFATKIYSFEMEVPNKRDLNIDMEWLYGTNEKENMEVDIGYIPLMKINATGPSTSSNAHRTKIAEINETNIVWSCMHDAQNLVEKTMYPFKETMYYNISEAFELAKREDKLVHSLVLWGSLDDQSC